MMIRWYVAPICALALVGAVASCGNEESEQISCVNSFDCPGALVCLDGWCVEDTGELPDNNGTGDPDVVDEDTDPGFDGYFAEDETPVDDSADLTDDEQVDTTADEDMVIDDTETDTDEASDAMTDETADETADTVTDTVVDTAADEDIVADTTPDVDTVVSGQTGAECALPADCGGSNVCAEVFTSQITNYCYLNCTAPNDTICNGTAWPQCTVVGSYALCLATATIVGNFTTTVDANPFVTGNNVALTINGTQNIQAACSAYQNTANDWVLQCSKILQTTPNKIQLDAVFFWPAAAHAAGSVAGAEGQVYETTYNSSNVVIDNWIRAFFLPTDGTLTLTQAGTTTGATVAGSLNFNGNAYNAQFAP